jgi:DNA-binding response OmpR family regulator
MRILVIEDEPRIAESLKRGLETEGFDVILAATGEEGFYLVAAQVFDLLVLDLMLPGRDGLEILRTVRQQGLATPVLILSARDTIQDRVHGLDLGADDYLVKPFAFEELLARIRVLLRRGRPLDALRLAVADLEVDRVARRVVRAGMTIDLTAREYDLLEYMMLSQGRTISREMLARDVWHEVKRATPLDNVIDVHIARLRKKVDQGRSRPLIHTIRGVGFMLGESQLP